MNFDTLLRKSGIPIRARGNAAAAEVVDITADSRRVKPGDLFVAIPGTRVDGRAFIADALSRGACAIVCEDSLPESRVPWAQVANARIALGRLGAALWNVTTDAMELVGITGTNGKTTVAHLFRKWYEKRFGAEGVWMFGTIDYELGGARAAASHTTPEAIEIFRFLAGAAAAPKAIVMEVSSHSLSLDRVGGLAFDCAVFTNLTQDHLDFHRTMERYYQAKKRLFTDFVKKEGWRIVNIDDVWGRRLAAEIGPDHTVTYGKAADADIRIVNFSCGWQGTEIELLEGNERVGFASSLRGTFNIYNMAAFYAGARAIDRALAPSMIEAAFAMGGMCGGASPASIGALRAAGRELGLAFQIVDDILDATSDTATLGKTAGKDARAGKATFVSVHGLEGARRIARERSDSAIAALQRLPGDSGFLAALTESLVGRDH